MRFSAQQLVDKIIDNTSTIDAELAYMNLLDEGEAVIGMLMEALVLDTHNKHHLLASILCDILVEVCDKDALTLLNELVYSPKHEIFTPAAHAIARMKTHTINCVLIKLLEHPAPQVRRIVVWQLGRNRATEAINVLIQHLNEIDLETLRGIIWSLGHIGDYRAVQYIEPFTQHWSSDISFMAKEAILRIKDKTKTSSI